METIASLQPHTVTAIPISRSKPGFNVITSGYNQFLRFPSFSRYPHARNVKFTGYIAQASAKISSSQTSEKVDSKENDIVFVAGATGKVGSRTVRELLKLGFPVKAGVRSAQRAGTLVQSVKEMKLEDAREGTQPVEKLEIVECDLEKQDQIRPAIGDASIVICCIGASEKEISDITGPYRIDFKATKNLIDAATTAKVDHFILLTSLGTNKIGFPAAILNLFWGVLIWKRKAEEALMASGLPYTIVRPGGMERPTDAYKQTHNTTFSEEDTLFGGQISNLQVAELLACMAKNPGLSYCKVVEVIAETTAPLTPLENLLAKIPSKRKPLVASEPDSSSSKTIISKVPAEPEVEVAKTMSRPLSPYAAYDNLKPPTSPTPSPVAAVKASDLEAKPLELKSTVLSEPLVENEEVKTTRPLSPYARYEDLKPPTSPTPTAPPRSQNNDTVLKTGASDTGTSASITAATLTEMETTPEEVVRIRPLSPAIYENLKPPSSPTPMPSGSNTTVEGNGAPKIIATAIIEDDASLINSPNNAYDDSKRPTSPSPTSPLSQNNDAILIAGASDTLTNASASVTETRTTTGEIFYFTFGTSETETDESTIAATPVETTTILPEQVIKTRPLSPFSSYEDLKPPSSPTPTPSGSKVTADVSSLTGGNDVPKIIDASQNISPNDVYDNLKPPTSPTPSPVAAVKASDLEAKPLELKSTVLSEPLVENEEVKKTRPLSPYARYEDLKPPTSPTPTAPSRSQNNDTVLKTGASDTGTSASIAAGSVTEKITATKEYVEFNFDAKSKIAATLTEMATTPEEVVKIRPLSPFAIYEDLKPPSSPTPMPSGSKATADVSSLLKGVNGIPIATNVIEEDASLINSPNDVYDNSKGQTSPTPTSPLSQNNDAILIAGASDTLTNASASMTETTTTTGEIFYFTFDTSETEMDESTIAATPVEITTILPEQVIKTRPLSPFSSYEDLKPPSSPTPIPNGSKVTADVSSLTGGNDVPKIVDASQNISPNNVHTEPLTSPSPIAPTISESATENNAAPPPTESNKQHNVSKPRPLSPYAVYEDLKPPTSPIPSGRNC